MKCYWVGQVTLLLWIDWRTDKIHGNCDFIYLFVVLFSLFVLIVFAVCVKFNVCLITSKRGIHMAYYASVQCTLLNAQCSMCSYAYSMNFHFVCVSKYLLHFRVRNMNHINMAKNIRIYNDCQKSLRQIKKIPNAMICLSVERSVLNFDLQCPDFPRIWRSP